MDLVVFDCDTSLMEAIRIVVSIHILWQCVEEAYISRNYICPRYFVFILRLALHTQLSATN